MSIILTIFDVSIKEKRVYGSICSELLPQQMSQSKSATYKISISIILTIFDVSIKEKRVYGSLCSELLPQQMSQSKSKYIDLCQHANKYKQVVLETLS